MKPRGGRTTKCHGASEARGPTTARPLSQDSGGGEGDAKCNAKGKLVNGDKTAMRGQQRTRRDAKCNQGEEWSAVAEPPVRIVGGAGSRATAGTGAWEVNGKERGAGGVE